VNRADGSPGLATALREQWPQLPIQRCTAHKLRNLEAKAPAQKRDAGFPLRHTPIWASNTPLLGRADPTIGLTL
jgi:transposase-like protein